MRQADSNQIESILGITWDEGVPCGRILNFSTDTVQEINLTNYQLSYRISEPISRICLGYHPMSEKEQEHSACSKNLEKGRKCEPCIKSDQIFAAGLHHAHTRDRGSLSAEILDHLQRPNYLYIAVFGDGSIKVGTSTARRIQTRLLEQGAFFASIICETVDGFLVRTLEDMVTSEIGLVQAISTKRKLKGILHPVPQNEIREILKNECKKVENFIGNLALEGYSMVLDNWENPAIKSSCWERVLKYPNNLSSGAHDLSVVSICGRIGAFKREDEVEFYVADLGEIFGMVIESGKFPTEDFTIQGQLF